MRSTRASVLCFNEAAGFTQRKPRAGGVGWPDNLGFNEAAGFTQRKLGPNFA